MNNTMNNISEMAGNIFGAIILIPMLGPRRALQVGYSITAIGGFSMLVYYYSTNYFISNTHTFTPLSSILFSTIILVAKFGISLNFCVLYSSTTLMFPPQFSIVGFSIANFFARMCTFCAP